jgi:exopolysaccharide biosynthesis polyprenyl glycosylphosphotransferase
MKPGSPTFYQPRLRLRTAERRVIMFIGDALAAILALAIALVFWSQRDFLNLTWEFLGVRIPFWFYLLPILWLFLNLDLYDTHRAGRRRDTFGGIMMSTGLSIILYLLVFFLSEPNSLPRRGVAFFIGSAALLTLIWRLIYISIFTQSAFLRRVLIVGAGKAGARLAEVVVGLKPKPFLLVGLVDDDPEKLNTQVCGFPVIGNSLDLEAIVIREQISDIVVAISGVMQPEMFSALLRCAEHSVDITTMPVMYEELLGRVPIFLLQSDWLLRTFLDQARSRGFYEPAKRLVDILVALVGLVVFIISYPFIALAILLETGAPILYSQERMGLNGKNYKMFKYRTMVKDAEKNGVQVTVANDRRITRVGHFLRKSHLDEIPQFFNILIGEMSMVGPRAERDELVQKLQEEVPFYRARLLVKPGLTGWAQVNFGYAATVEDTGIKLEYDLYYIKARSLVLDMVILFRTVSNVLGLRGR